MDRAWAWLERRQGWCVLAAMLLGAVNARWVGWTFSNHQVTLLVTALVVFPALAVGFGPRQSLFPSGGRLIVPGLALNLALSPLVALGAAWLGWGLEQPMARSLLLLSLVPSSAMVLPLLGDRGGDLRVLMGLVAANVFLAAWVCLPWLTKVFLGLDATFPDEALLRGVALIYMGPWILATLLKTYADRRMDRAAYARRLGRPMAHLARLGIVLSGFAVMSLPYDYMLWALPGWWWGMAWPVALYLGAYWALTCAAVGWAHRRGLASAPSCLALGLAVGTRNVNVCFGLVLTAVVMARAVLLLPPLFAAYALQAMLTKPYLALLERVLRAPPRGQ